MEGGGGVVLHPVLARGVPHPVLAGGIPQGTPWSRPGMGYHLYQLDGVPPVQTRDLVPSPISWMGYHPMPGPGPGMGYPIQTRDGIPPPISWMGTTPPAPGPGMGYPHLNLDLGWGTPLSRPGMGYPPSPPSRCELTNKLKTVPSPIIRMRAVKICDE